MPNSVNIAGYELLDKLGAGASGTVYKARQVSMDRLVAIKILPEEVAQDTRFTKRFTREARAVAKLNHPHVVTGIDVGESGGVWYFVMEYVDGESAEALVKGDRPISEKDALEITRQIALALEHAYKNGIVHRDIKPANILMTSTGVAKLADLGVAKQGEGDGDSGGRVFGTPYYMSPEQARGDADIDIRSDIYSLGATLYHLLTGKPPFHGHPPAVVMAKQIAEEPDDPRKLNPKISRAAVALVDCMMAKDRNDRPNTPSDLQGEIERVQKGRAPSTAKPASHTTGRARRHAKPAPQAASGSGGMAAAAVLGVMIVLGAAAWMLLGSNGNSNTRKQPTGRTNTGTRKPPRTAASPGQRRPDPEARARNAFRDLRERELRPEKELSELQELIKAHPNTMASRDAASWVKRLEVSIASKAAERAMAKKVADLREQAMRFAERGQFNRALGVLKKETTGTMGSMLASEIADLRQMAGAAMARTGNSVASLCEEGAFFKARETINAINFEGMADLVAEQKKLLASIDDFEKSVAEENKATAVAAAKKVYSALCAKVNSALAEFKPNVADNLLRAARRDKRLAPIADYLKQDLVHVGYFREVVAAAAKGAASLKGNTRTFKMRNGTDEVGKIEGADSSGIAVQQRVRSLGGATVRRTLYYAKMSDVEIVALAMSALSRNSRATGLKTAVLYAVGGDVVSAKKELDAARKLGADTSSVERRWIKAASEIRAGRLLTEAWRLYDILKAANRTGNKTAIVKAKRELSKVLTELKKYSDTKVYKASFPKSAKD